jgi:mannose-6-phosphate isomerase
MQPFKLEPEYREYVWGGNRIRPDAGRTAEAWLVYEGNTIKEGPLKGMLLSDAAAQEGETLLGRTVVEKTGKRFPLLIKLLDTADWLSLQVHPNNAQAEFWEGTGNFGKTEAWFIVEAEDGAQLVSGLKTGTTKEAITRSVGTRDLLKIIERKLLKAGDAILISPGTIHALSAGLLVYEVQQTSDITYRVYDWDRPMKAGRKLHLEQAADVLDPKSGGDLVSMERDHPGKDPLIACEFFALRVVVNNDQSVQCDTRSQSFHCLTMVEGEGIIEGEGWQRRLGRFETLLIPASCGRYHIHTGTHTCLAAYVPG